MLNSPSVSKDKISFSQKLGREYIYFFWNAGHGPRVVSVHDEAPLLILWDAARIQGFDREGPVSELREVMRRAK